MLRAIITSVIAVMLLLVVGSPTMANDKKPNSQKASKRLASLKALDLSNSSGIAKTFVKVGKKLVQNFQVIAVDLQPNTEYRLEVDGITIDNKLSNKLGTIEFSYSSKIDKDKLGDLEALPKEITLVKTIKNIRLYQQETLVLNGDFISSVDDDTASNLVIPNVTIEAGKTVTLNVSVTDPQGSPVTLSVACDRGNFVTATGLTVMVAPQMGDVGQTVCTVTASDPINLSTSASFVITVTAANRAPMIATVMDQRVRLGATLRVTVQGSDPDGDPLRFAVPTAPLSLINVGTNTDGSAILTFAPTALNQGGQVVVQVIDSQGLTAQTSFNLTIDPNVIISSVLREKNLLFVAGQGFGTSGVRVTINGQDLSARVIGQTDSTLTIKGARRKANLRAGTNQLVVTSNGISATFVFSLRDLNTP